MLGMLMNASLTLAPNTWKIWVDHIMKKNKVFGIKKAAMVHKQGTTASATSGFILPQADIQRLQLCFGDEKDRPESITVQGKTYVIKQVDGNQLIAFNGSKYIIVGQAKTMYVIALSDSRQKHVEAANWIGKLACRLVEKDF